MIVSATIGTVTLTSDQTSGNGLEMLEGWYGSAPIKTQPADRPNSNGSFGLTKFYRSARPITIAGLLSFPDDTSAVAGWLEMAGLMGSGVPQTLTVTDELGPTHSEVMLYGAGCTLEPLVNGMASYVLSLLAFDPVRYGSSAALVADLPSASGGLEYELYEGGAGGALYYGGLGNLGRIEAVNTGTAETWPFFTITGELTTGFTITCLETGQQLRYDRLVPAGGFVTIDSRTGEVLVDGISDASTYLTRDEFFAIPAMGTVTIQFNAISTSSGTPQMTVLVASGWY